MHQHCTYLSSLLGCDLTVSADPQPGDLLYPKVAIITKGSFIKRHKNVSAVPPGFHRFRESFLSTISLTA